MSPALHKLAALCSKELRLLLRDRHGLLVLFAMPTAFILIMSLALQNVFESHKSGAILIAVEDRDGAPLARALVQRLSAQNQFRLMSPVNDTAASGSVKPALTVILLPGFSELLATRYDFADDYMAGKAEPELLKLDYSSTLPAPMRGALELAMRQAVISVQADYLLSTVLERPEKELKTLRYLLDPAHLPIGRLEETSPVPSAVQQSVPAWLIFALFFTVIPLSTSFVIEREQGTLLRFRVIGISPGLLFAAKLIAYYIINLVQIVLMLFIGVYVVPLLGGDELHLGRSYVGLWLIGSATSVAAIGLALLVAVNVRSILQATATGGALCLLMGALGGIMVPSVVMPQFMQRAAQVSPMAWSLDGFLELLLRNGSWLDVLRESGILIFFALACLAIAALGFRRRSL